MPYIHDREAYAREFEKVIDGKQIYLFGAGMDCRDFVPKFQEEIVGIFDNDFSKQGQSISDIPILHSSKLKSVDSDKSVFIITSSAREDIEIQLKENGIKYIYYYPFIGKGYIGKSIYDLIARHSYDILNSDYFNVNDLDLDNIHLLKQMLADDLSRELIDIIVERRKSKYLFYGDIKSKNQYFQNEILKFTNDEVMIDGGAYTGDTINNFCKMTNNFYKKIFAFEPDKKNYEVLCANTKQNPKIICINAGLWNEETVLKFTGFETASSAISENGNIKIKVKSIDETVKNEKVTFIKMDIEGAEQKALQGAKKIIMRDRPKLAICLYHEKADLWEIPFYLKKLVPEYKFYIRHHSDTIFETVLYATME